MESTKAKYMKETRAFFRKNEMCTQCGSKDAFTMNGRSMCAECIEKRREYMSDYRAKNREKMREYDRNLTARRKASGICVKCGRDMNGDKDHVSCEYCRAKDAARQREKRATIRWLDGVCYHCASEPVIPGKRLCQSCYEKACVSVANARECINKADHPWQKDEQLRIMSIKGDKI